VGQGVHHGDGGVRGAAVARTDESVHGTGADEVRAYIYGRLRAALWVEGGGPVAGMEFGTVLWLPILFATVGGSIWWTRVRALHRATMWAWLVRLNAAGLVVGFLMK
jgi:hypothetical protein